MHSNAAHALLMMFDRVSAPFQFVEGIATRLHGWNLITPRETFDQSGTFSFCYLQFSWNGHTMKSYQRGYWRANLTSAGLGTVR